MIKRHTFENGFQLVYQKSHQTIPLTSIHILCNVGSAYEIEPIRGGSHLVEHMCFKGTHDRSNAHNLLLQYNKIGANINAYTEKRITGYTLACDDAHVANSIKTLADMLLDSVFSEKEFNKEQHVVVEETIRIKDNSENVLEKLLDEQYFRGSSYQYPIDIIDYHPSATHLKYNDIRQWYEWFYRPDNMVCSVVSNLSFASIMKIITSSTFMKNQKKSTAQVYFYPTLHLTPINDHFVYCKKKGVSVMTVHVGFRTCSYYSHDKYKIKILKHIFNGLSGRLFTAFRTKRGLTYHTSTHSTYYEHAGYFNFYIETDPRKIVSNGKTDGVMPILISLIMDLLVHGITEKELETAKENCKGKFLIELQSIDSVANYNGLSTILNDKDVPFQNIYNKHIKPIICKQVNDVIRKYITYENLVAGFVYDSELPKDTIEHLFSVLKK